MSNKNRITQNNAKLDELINLLATKAVPEGGTAEWKPNPTWWDIEKILEEDTRDYPAKAIMLLYANDVEEEIFEYSANAYATSDGAFYELESAGSVTHNWDLTKDKPCIEDGVEAYKTRYLIAYYNASQIPAIKDKYKIIYLTTKSEAGTVLNGKDQFYNAYSLEAIKNYNTTGIKSFYQMFYYCRNLKSLPELDMSSATNAYQMFYQCRSLKSIPPLDTKKVTDFRDMFNGCYRLETIPQLDTSKATGNMSFSSVFEYCYSLKTIPLLDISNVTSVSDLFRGCSSLITIPQLDIGNVTSTSAMFQDCSSLQKVPQLDTRKVMNFSNMFSSCSCLETVPLLDMRSTYNKSNCSGMFNSCKSLKNLTLKNIIYQLTIGSGTSYGHKLTLDSLLNTIKELHDNTAGTSTQTLTVGSANLTKLADVYVKLVDITDEMRAEDEYIDLKKPFVVCESTDEGAMLITEYVTTVKNWQLA